jgi:ABC-2 type transport system ATP-binding protein
VGGDSLLLYGSELEALQQRLQRELGLPSQRVGPALRVEHPQGHELLRELVARYGDAISSCSLGKPTLEDVFMQRTGRRFQDADLDPTS